MENISLEAREPSSDEEDIWDTEFSPTIDKLVANLQDGEFDFGDDHTVRIPIRRFTDILAQVRSAQSSHRRQRGDHAAKVNRHRDTLARVTILLTGLRSAHYTINQAVTRGSEIERRYATLLNMLEQMFQDLSSEDDVSPTGDEAEGQPNKNPPSDEHWDRIQAEAPSPSQHA